MVSTCGNCIDPFVGFNCTDEEKIHFLATLRHRKWQALLRKSTNKPQIPRYPDIDSAFKVSKGSVSSLLCGYPLPEPRLIPCSDRPSLEYPLPFKLSDLSDKMEEFDFESTLTIFSETKALDISNQFRRDADAY